MAQLQRTVVNTDKATRPIGPYSQAIRVKAGELGFRGRDTQGLDAKGDLVGVGDAAAQTKQTLENIRQVLLSVGASMSNVVEFVTYLVGKESIQPFRQARDEAFATLYPGGDYPPNTLLIVEALVLDELLVEIKAIAALP